MGFDLAVPPDGYAWWYLDALSPDGRHGLTVIAFVGSVFSPYYAAARASGSADPLAHCALNVCLYLPRAPAWTLTERPAGEVEREAGRFRIGPSALDWDGRRLLIRIDEETAVRRRPVKGVITVTPGPLQGQGFALDPGGRHWWRPLAVAARVEARFESPAASWAGEGYLDRNAGSAPLERDFRAWSWSRTAADGDGRAEVFYEVAGRDGAERALALSLSEAGAVAIGAPPPRRRLGPTAWALPRAVRAAPGPAWVVRAFEDTPFYARSSVKLCGPGAARRLLMHERLDLDRFSSPLMQWALPYRIPRPI